MQNNHTSQAEKNTLQTNENAEHRPPTGLIVTGLAVIVGSWVGMAAFVDYRLDGVEKKFQIETRQVVSTVDKSLNNELSSLKTEISTKVTDTSSVLAKGILDLNQSEEQRYNQMLKAINNNGSIIEKNRTEIASTISKEMKDNEKQIASLLTRNKTETTNKVTQVINSAVEKQKEHNQALTDKIAVLEQNTNQIKKDMISAVKNVDKSLETVNTNIVSQITQSAKSMEDLIKLSNKGRSEQLSELASTVDSLINGVQDESKKLTTELNTLAHRVQTLQKDINTSQASMRELTNLVPDWCKSSETQLASLKETADTLDQRVEKNIGALQLKIKDLNKAVDETAQTLMKSLYLATEGLEDTKIEIKSNLTKSKQETSAELNSLAQSIEGIAESLKNVEKLASNDSAVSQANTAINRQEIKKIKQQIGGLSTKMQTIHTKLSSQVAEAKARAQTLLGDMEQTEQSQSLEELIQHFNEVTGFAENQLGVVKQSLESLSKVVTALKDPETGAESEEKQVSTTMKTTSSAAGSNTQEGSTKAIEDKNDDEISLY